MMNGKNGNPNPIEVVGTATLYPRQWISADGNRCWGWVLDEFDGECYGWQEPLGHLLGASPAEAYPSLRGETLEELWPEEESK